MNFIDLAYYYNRISKPELLLEAHRPNLGYFDFLPKDWHCLLVKFADARGHTRQPGFDYYYFQGNASKLWTPLAANRSIARLNPDVVMLHGLIFPQQTLLLKAQLPKNVKFIIQHHAEQPAKGLMRKLQQQVNKYIDAYLFSTRELADPWVEAGIIEKEKVFEMMEGSSAMQRLNKIEAREHLGISGSPVFLWVGRLDSNKDPITVLKAFENYLKRFPSARLFMVYHDGDLLPLVKARVHASALLSNSVELIGKLERKELAYWYSAADYYLSGSHSEGSGYALIEAMSCGCIPVVTDIPSFRKITNNGTVGFLFKPGEVESLSPLLFKLEIPNENMVSDVLTQFENELSFKAIAQGLTSVCNSLMSRGNSTSTTK